MSYPTTNRETNVRDFPHTPKKRENKNYERDASSSSSSTSTTTTVKESQKLLIRVNCEDLRQLYAECIGTPMPMAIHRRVLLALEEGTPYQYFQYALNEAAMAPRPSWRYVMAIVARLYRDGVSPEELLPWM